MIRGELLRDRKGNGKTSAPLTDRCGFEKKWSILFVDRIWSRTLILPRRGRGVNDLVCMAVGSLSAERKKGRKGKILFWFDGQSCGDGWGFRTVYSRSTPLTYSHFVFFFIPVHLSKYSSVLPSTYPPISVHPSLTHPFPQPTLFDPPPFPNLLFPPPPPPRFRGTIYSLRQTFITTVLPTPARIDIKLI